MVLMPWIAEAAGLGRLTVISGLGEPLNAEIELISTTPEELSTLTASIAPEEAYEIQGIERAGIHNAIKIDVDKKSGGTPVLKLSTRQPVSEPFLDMLIQVDWATGRLLREYTVLLDPPGYDSQQSTSTATAPVVTPSAPAVAAGKQADSGFSDRPPSPTDTSAEETPEDRETVRGDTLSSIAREMQVDGISLEQMLVGLYRANKEAFVDGNMNRLKVGEIIRAPSVEELTTIGQREAVQEIRVQTADWNAYRNQLAGIVADSEATSEDVSNQSTSGRITGPAEDRAAASDAEQDVVKLSKSDTSNTTNKNLQDRLSALQEEVTARENSLQEANERTAALEKQIQDMQELLAIKNEALANAQMTATGQNSPTVNTDPATPAQPSAAAPETNTAQTQATAPANQPATQSKPATPAPKKAVVPPPAPTQSPSFLDDLLQTQLLPLIAAGVLALLVGMWLFLRNKRRRELDSFEKGILTSGGLKANTVFGNTAANTVDTGDTSFLTDFSQSTGGMIDTHDVDPIAEAEVYMAYGRDAQAEEILKDAIAKEPKRYELHLKLLEIFAARNDTSSFETVAGELYATLGASDPNWAKVAEIGRKLEPDNPLYATAAAGAAAAVASSVKAEPTETASGGKPASEFADAELIGSTNLDFSLNSDQSAQAEAPLSNEGVLELNQKTLPTAFTEDTTPEANLGQTVTVMDEPLADDKSMEELNFSEPPAADTVQLDAADFGQTIAFQNTVSESDAPTFDVPEMAPAPVVESEVKTELPDLNFELPETANDEEKISSAEEKPVAAMQDMPSLDFPAFDETQVPNLDLTAPAPEEKIVFEAMPVQPEEATTLNFDVEFESAEAPAPADNKAPELDLSSISLDLGGNADVEKDAMGAESAEVNTKIDLVNAYLDMDDTEGAKELLEEVLREGGPNQRQHAQKILNGLA
jgi:pilus assembly protein FimV